jgi:hypothetical protein
LREGGGGERVADGEEREGIITSGWQRTQGTVGWEGGWVGGETTCGAWTAKLKVETSEGRSRQHGIWYLLDMEVRRLCYHFTTIKRYICPCCQYRYLWIATLVICLGGDKLT